ncbi:unnamed protein product [Clonostachys solani]|uniref:Uncharacterized protein n=1 Tax=Clonostachys solani TaxID=160281 RepID=A0A9N9W5P1_9HYPO|nr:unnamed protein product [Clonostachys solani]
MTTYSPFPAYIFGAACVSRGVMASLSPRAEYGHMGLPLEAPGPVEDASTGLVSPLMYYKGIREISYGATMVALQQQGLDKALTTFGDGLVVWLHGGPELRYKAWGHWITGAVFAGWVSWRWTR